MISTLQNPESKEITKASRKKKNGAGFIQRAKNHNGIGFLNSKMGIRRQWQSAFEILRGVISIPEFYTEPNDYQG